LNIHEDDAQIIHSAFSILGRRALPQIDSRGS
jgi:hypothetical protein